MLKNILYKLLKTFGKNYTIDPNIPDKLIISILFQRLVMLLRGIVKTRHKIFLGKNVKINNRSNFKFGAGCTIEEDVLLDCYGTTGVVLGNSSKIGSHSIVSTTSHLSKLGVGLKIGNNSSIGSFSYYGRSGGIEIGSDVIMGEYISFHSENHNFSDKSMLIREQGVVSEGIILGNNIWVGAKVTFIDGCKVGDNSVIAAGAVVKGHFPDNKVIGGVPAKILKTL
jgi:acetyltransferase-like isoleucine patch superfamily enzyme